MTGTRSGCTVCHIMQSTAKYIKEARTELGLTQKQLAEKIGSKRYNIAKYERNLTMPPGDVILNIQALLQKKRKR